VGTAYNSTCMVKYFVKNKNGGTDLRLQVYKMGNGVFMTIKHGLFLGIAALFFAMY